ncbi:unnamed protein product [Calypogeia fissa]
MEQQTKQPAASRDPISPRAAIPAGREQQNKAASAGVRVRKMGLIWYGCLPKDRDLHRTPGGTCLGMEVGAPEECTLVFFPFSEYCVRDREPVQCRAATEPTQHAKLPTPLPLPPKPVPFPLGTGQSCSSFADGQEAGAQRKRKTVLEHGWTSLDQFGRDRDLIFTDIFRQHLLLTSFVYIYECYCRVGRGLRHVVTADTHPFLRGRPGPIGGAAGVLLLGDALSIGVVLVWFGFDRFGLVPCGFGGSEQIVELLVVALVEAVEGGCGYLIVIDAGLRAACRRLETIDSVNSASSGAPLGWNW